MTPGTPGAGSAVWSRRSFLFVCSLVRLVRPARADETTVEIHQFKFAPAELEIKAGSTVTFVNLDLVPHTATGDAFDTGTLKKGERKAVTFSTSGELPYLCKFHPHMKGRIVVR
ncbi:MAG TPA: cupredoxin family copper-binding protein [Dongiaceae bacterium]|nr:cupredoxin family copper-binding protein [Dongiaceae bacterium]